MRTKAVVEMEVPADRRNGVADTLIGLQVNFLVLHAAPQPLDEHIVSPAALAIHADLDTCDLQNISKGDTGEPAALGWCS